MKKLVAVVFVLAIATGCSVLDTQEKATYDLMEKDGVLVMEKNPTTGAWLGLLPGGGAFYGRAPAIGVVDLLLWWPSVFWDPFVGYERAKKVNYDATMVELSRNKRKDLASLENQRDRNEIDDVEYSVRKREIEQNYDYGVER